MDALKLYKRACKVWVALPVGAYGKLRKNAENRLIRCEKKMLERYGPTNGIAYANRLMLECSIEACHAINARIKALRAK